MSLLDRFRKEVPEPEPDAPPVAASGRGHSSGFLDLEEHNVDLQHPNGAAIYDKMYRTDADIRQVVQLSANPAVGGTWEVEPYGGEDADDEAVNQADFVRWALWDQMRPNLIGHLAEFLPVLIRNGFAPGEVPWMAVKWKGETKIVPRTIALRLPRTIHQFEQDRFGQLTRIKQFLPTPVSALVRREDGDTDADIDGDNPGEVWLDAKHLVYYRLGAEGDNWEGVSLLRPAYKHWVYKDTIEKIDAIAQEREALGIPICYPPMGATTEQLDVMEDILSAMRTNEEGFILAPGPKSGPGMAPEGQGWLVEVIGYDRTGTGRDPQPSLAYHTQKIAAAFIAEFMRLGHGETGARATAQVQADPFLMSIEALVSVVEQQLNDAIVGPLIAWNFPGVENPPKLKMSLVDATNLAQLADYVLKLSQIGALFPDQRLENFLRARADLPPADPAAVKSRGKEDDKIRREIVSPPEPDPFGQNADPGKPHGVKDAKGTNPGAKGGMQRGKKDGSKRLDASGGDILLDGDITGPAPTTLSYDEYGERSRHRDQRWYEMCVDLDKIEDELDDMPNVFERTGREHVAAIARGDEAAKNVLRNVMSVDLNGAYDSGAHHVCNEVYAQRMPVEDILDFQKREHVFELLISLDRGARDRRGALEQRADIAGRQVQSAMDHAREGADLAHGDPALAQAAAEKAGVAALRRVGHQHGVAALLHGRHDQGHQLAEADNGITIMGARYTAILDRGTCPACMEADDGVLRPLDDPVRRDRQPPNHHCHSTASGFNMCRCFEVFEVMPPNHDPQLDANDNTMPEFVRTVAEILMTSGMRPARSVATAKALARHYCRTGKLVWPGLGRLGLERTMACDATGWQQ